MPLGFIFIGKDPVYFGFDSIKKPFNAVANALISALELGFSLSVFKKKSKKLKEFKKIKKMIKRVKIEAYQVGLVMKNGALDEVLNQGNHWLWGTNEVKLYDMKQSFVSPIELTIALKNSTLAAMLEVVEVKEHEIVLFFANGLFREVLGTGRYAFWKGYQENSFTKVDLSKVEISEPISKTILENMKVKSYVRKFQIMSFEQGLLFVNDVFQQKLESGVYYFWNNAIPVEVKKVDVRQQQIEILGQELLTKDKATLRMNFFARYQVTDIMKAIVENKDFEKQLYVMLQLALRAFVGTYTLDELLSKKDDIANIVLEEVAAKMESLGLVVSDAGIRDVILPGEMKDIMNQVLMAEKKAQANSIMRREETAAMRNMLNTAKLMEENEMLWKLKEMEYVEKISDKIGEITVSGSGNLIGQLKEIFVK
ncbi:peptidase [Flavobacterium branchiophilum NBRC 15030 = ATCC 35035]|uniref:SPFH domain/Band 7 family protein n=2 Tax=Flavobacterium branchiophilum TaxID=55197 RepID=A0A543G1N6_9FLAO|nr:SPFH domain/Band 7 family protein [Flavobacterium branchiophilum]GEM55359.1 peptidase [Flavobacterium branchiophilum NBRC 15030 = ATCC 35035]